MFRKRYTPFFSTLLEWGSLFLFGAAGYGCLELLWRGRTHWTMLLAGGLCLCLLRSISRLPLAFGLQCILGAAAITGIELAIGLVCNRLLHWEIWDYSDRWGNFMGQICPGYCLLWLAIAAAALGAMRCFDRPE